GSVPRVFAGAAPRAAERAPFRRRKVGSAARGAAPAGRASRSRTTGRPLRLINGERQFFGHPRGLSTLFFTEMWERFSYYGMRGFLILYMTKALGFTDAHASSAYATYVSSVWLTPILGGLIADAWLGQ